MDRLLLRSAVVADALTLTDIHIRSWQWAYQGLLPAAYLAQLDASRERRIAWWNRMLQLASPEDRYWVAEQAAQIVGFAHTSGTCQDEDVPPQTAELHMIYLAPEVVGQGIGRALLTQASDDLRQRGYASAKLWVLETNERARRFYEKAGWRADGRSKVEQRADSLVLNEVRYELQFS